MIPGMGRHPGVPETGIGSALPSSSVPRTAAILQPFPTPSPADLEALPAELRERFPQVIEDLRNGLIDQVPDAVLDQLPVSVVDRIPSDFLANGTNVTFAVALGAIAAISLLGFLYGLSKAAAKAATFFLLVGAIAATMLYTQF